MMLALYRASVMTVALAAFTTAASAASLQVAPTTLEIPTGGNAATVNLKNNGKTAIKAQVRVFRWTMVGGKEQLEPARDVVASPPIATIKSNMDYTVRIVRLSKKPAQSEETYRLMIDEIVDPATRQPGTVTMAFRYSIPVFFMPAVAPKPSLVWSTTTQNGKTIVTANNTGGRRIRVADLVVSTEGGKQVQVAKGLAGYVLARSGKSWVVPSALQSAGRPLSVTAVGDLGPIHAQAQPQ